MVPQAAEVVLRQGVRVFGANDGLANGVVVRWGFYTFQFFLSFFLSFFMFDFSAFEGCGV